MKKRFKTIIAIGLTFATVLGSYVTTWAASTDAADVGTVTENMSLVIENGVVKEELCAEHIVIEKYDNIIEFNKATKRVDAENWKYAPDSYDREDVPFISNCVVMRVNADTSFAVDAEHIVTIIQYTENNYFYIQYDSEEAAEAAAKVLDEMEGIVYAAQNARIPIDIGKPSEDPTQEPSDLPYIDVSVTDWFYPAVKALFDGRNMIGDPGNRFDPDGVMSRAHIVTVLYRMEDRPETVYDNRFPDVPDGVFYTKPVMWASGKDVGVISGYADKTFGPADYITREQMAVMMYRYAKYKGYDVSEASDLKNFADRDKVSEFAETAMKWAVGAGLIKGEGQDGLLNPQVTMSRAVGATIIHRFNEKYPNNK